MFRIGEFSRMAQVTVRTLHHYDELGLLKPAHIDRFTDYRYYTVDQLPRLNRILAFKELGLSLEQIVQLLNEDVPIEQMRGMLMMKQAEIDQHIQQELMRLRRVEARLQQIEQEGKAPTYEVVLKKVEAMMIVSTREVVPAIEDMPRYRCSMLHDVYCWVAEQRLKQRDTEFMLYYTAEYTEQNLDMEVAVEVDKASSRALTSGEMGRITLRELPAVTTMASVIHHGTLYELGQAMVALFTWIGSNGYVTSGPYREVHLGWYESDEDVNVNDVAVEIQVPIERKTA